MKSSEAIGTHHGLTWFVLFAGAIFTAPTFAQTPPAGETQVALNASLALGHTCGARRGLCVTSVQGGGLASRAGLQTGDVLRAIDASEVNDIAQLQAALRNGKTGQRPTLTVSRNGEVLLLLAEITADDVRPTARPPTPAPAAPFEILQPAHLDGLRARLADHDDVLHLDGDVLTIVHRDARDAVVLGGSLQLPMSRIAGTDIWYLQLKRPDWDRAFFSYRFAEKRSMTLEMEPMQEYRGARAPRLDRAATLEGTISVRTISSKHLKEDRAVSVYLPPGSRSSLRTLFMTDGATIEWFARVVEPLIVKGAIAPIAIIATHASVAPGVRPGIDGRSEEYVPVVAPAVFARHLQFYVEEVMPAMTRELGLSERREHRALFGFSSGAAFAMTAAARHAGLFAHVLPFSLNLPKVESAARDGQAYHFAAGELEPHFLAATRSAHEQLAAGAVSTSLRAYMSGHDLMMWQLALGEFLPEIFPAR